MKKLFLASSGLEYIKTFVGKDPRKLRMLFIPTAGNLDKNAWWIDKDRDVLRRMGFRITELDIAQATTAELQSALQNTDIVYIAGGNTFYLLKQLRDTGFDALLCQFIENGGLYAGASAGALIAGVDIEPVSAMDDPKEAAGLSSTKGLGLVSIVPIPHYDMTDRTKIIDDIKQKYSEQFEIVLLTDDRAIVVDDGDWEIVSSIRSPFEYEWFNKNHDKM